MGNCVETCSHQHPLSPTATDPTTHGKEVGGGGVRLKVVLTKEELDWLLLQLSATTTTTTSTASRLGGPSVLGSDKLEEFLMVIECARRERIRKSNAEVSWKPSLESITEAPESLEMDRS